MENENIIDSGAVYSDSQLTVSPMASGYLNETGRWGKFLAILGFCFIGLMVLIGLFAGSFVAQATGDGSIPGFAFTLLYLVIGALYFFPVYYLYKFSKQVRTALARKDNKELDSAFENLKSHYKFLGIAMIIVLAIYAVALLGGLLAGAAALL